MDFGCGSSAGGSGAKGSEALKRKWSDLEATMKEMKDATVKENAEKSAKIRRLMEDNIRLEETVLRLENPSFQGPTGSRPMTRSNPFALFPAEVWEVIIGNINRSSDLQMLCLAFPQLKPVVKKTQKTIFLFENVLPFLCKDLGLKDINNCRLMCDKWNQDICTLLAYWNAPNLVPQALSLSNNEVTSTLTVPDCKPPSRLTGAYTFQSNRKVLEFLEEMVNHPGNPFLGRILSLSLGRQREKMVIYWESVLKLVKRFGQNIWNLKMDWFGGQKPVTFYKALQEILIYCPNLKYLTIDCNIKGNGPSLRTMAALIMSSPISQMPYLQSLKLTFRDGGTEIIGALSSLFSPQIHQLELLGKTIESADLKDECLRGLINLECLKVDLKCEADISRVLQFPSKNLKKLFVNCENYPAVFFPTEQVGNLLEKFSQLEHLDLGNCQVVPSSFLDQNRQFLRLKTLKIAIRVEEYNLQQHNLDVLLWLPQLKHLVIYQKGPAGTYPFNYNYMERHSTLKIVNCLHTSEMLDSNIWTLIPSLELLEIDGWRKEKYTRRMFENRVG